MRVILQSTMVCLIWFCLLVTVSLYRPEMISLFSCKYLALSRSILFPTVSYHYEPCTGETDPLAVGI